jgi:hypothetical protein
MAADLHAWRLRLIGKKPQSAMKSINGKIWENKKRTFKNVTSQNSHHEKDLHSDIDGVCGQLFCG